VKAPRTVTIALAALTIALANPATLRAAGSTTTGTNTATHDLLVVRTGTVYGSLTILPTGPGQAARNLPSGIFDRGGHVLAEILVGSGQGAFRVGSAEDGPAGRAGPGHDGGRIVFDLEENIVLRSRVK